MPTSDTAPDSPASSEACADSSEDPPGDPADLLEILDAAPPEAEGAIELDLAGELGAVHDRLTDLRADVQRMAVASARSERTVAELRAALDALLQILRVRETLSSGHIEMIDKLRRHVRIAAEPQLTLNGVADKYAVELAEIDCDARMHLCHGRCCSYKIPLSEQDLVEGKVAWRIHEPYYLAQRESGGCLYQSEETGACGNYQYRPAPCRTYDCTHDPRVWIDFEQRIPAPMPDGLVTIRRRNAGAKPSAPGAS
jgi:Fe-S-cluster containining protein